jgi:hypothetical protein
VLLHISNPFRQKKTAKRRKVDRHRWALCVLAIKPQERKKKGNNLTKTKGECKKRRDSQQSDGPRKKKDGKFQLLPFFFFCFFLFYVRWHF